MASRSGWWQMWQRRSWRFSDGVLGDVRHLEARTLPVGWSDSSSSSDSSPGSCLCWASHRSTARSKGLFGGRGGRDLGGCAGDETAACGEADTAGRGFDVGEEVPAVGLPRGSGFAAAAAGGMATARQSEGECAGPGPDIGKIAGADAAAAREAEEADWVSAGGDAGTEAAVQGTGLVSVAGVGALTAGCAGIAAAAEAEDWRLELGGALTVGGGSGLPSIASASAAMLRTMPPANGPAGRLNGERFILCDTSPGRGLLI